MTINNQVETFNVNFETLKPRKIETPDDTPWLFGGLDFGQIVSASAFESFELTDEGRLEEFAFGTWQHKKYSLVAQKITEANRLHPHQEIGFDVNSVGNAAIELFDTSMLPMTPIKTTQNMKIDMVNSIEILRQKGLLKFKKDSIVPYQLEGQLEKKSDNGKRSYPHGSVPNDSLWACGYAVITALPYMIHSGEPYAIRQGDSLYHSKVKMNIDNNLAKMMGQDSFGENITGSADKMKFLRNYKKF